MWAIYEDGNPQRIALAGAQARLLRQVHSIRRPADRTRRAALRRQERSRRFCICRRAEKPARKCPASCTSPAWTASKKINPASGDPFIERGFAVLSIDGPGQGETREGGIQMHRVQLRRRRQARLRLFGQAPGDRRRSARHHGFEHGLLLGAARGRGGKTFQSLRRQRRLHGTGPVRDLQHVVADVQIQLHVHVRLRRRSRVRRILQNACRSKASPRKSPARTWSSPAKTTSTAT